MNGESSGRLVAGGLNNLKQVGRKFILQGGTHRNLAVVKSQVDFIRSKIPDAEVVVHPHPGEAGAIGAALVAIDWLAHGFPTQFRGFDGFSIHQHWVSVRDPQGDAIPREGQCPEEIRRGIRQPDFGIVRGAEFVRACFEPA